MTNEQKLTIESYNNSAEGFKTKISQIDNYNETYEYFTSLISDGDEVLDLACGPAQIPKYILKSKKVSVTGVDLSDGMLSIAREEIPDGNFVNHSIIDYSDGKKYDACILGFGIPYLSSDETNQCICNASENIADGGHFYISFMSTSRFESAGEMASEDSSCDSYVNKDAGDLNKQAAIKKEVVMMEKTSFGGDNLFEIHYHNKDQIAEYIKKSGMTIVKEFLLPYKESDGSVTEDVIFIARLSRS